MKRIYVILIAGFLAHLLPLSAQGLAQNEAAIIYAMPKTILYFEIEYEKKTQEVGPFYQYSERYLGVSDVVTSNQVTYQIKTIKLLTKTVADENRKYKIVPDKKSLTSYIALNEAGILCAINDTYTKPQKKVVTEKAKQQPEQKSGLMPLGEEQMQANSTAKMAEGAAKQIYRIRESRMNMLAGDVDKMPADGQSMKTVLRELANTEQAISELFIGKTSTETLRQKIEYIPTESQSNYILGRFSVHAGLVSVDDLGGTPIYLNMEVSKQEYATSTNEKQKTTPAIFYNLPGSAHVSVAYNRQIMLEENLTIPQFGISVALPDDMFQQSDIKIHFNPKTGALLSVEK